MNSQKLMRKNFEKVVYDSYIKNRKLSQLEGVETTPKLANTN